MKYRLATILDREVHASDITKVIDLNLADPVSQFVIIHEPYNSVSGVPTAHPAKCITKIELVDGSDVLFSLSGQEAQAADWYHNKHEPVNHIIYLPTMYSEQVFNINFGRYLYDPLYAFNPKKFTNPQLKITIDVNGGGSTVTTGYLTVLAHIFDEKAVTPEGFFMHKEIKDYVPGASAHEYTDLPTDYPYRKLFIKAQKYAVGPEYLINTIKLSEENDRRIPLNHTISQVLKTMVGQSRAYQEWILVEGSLVSKVGYCTPAYWPTFQATMWEGTASAWGVAVLEGDGGRFKVDMDTGQGNTQLLATGWCPHGVIEIPFGLQDDPADWYDVSNLGSLSLDILAQSGFTTGDSCAIFLQQLRKYAA